MITTRYVFGLPMITLPIGSFVVEGIIDTGFNGALCLPVLIVNKLGLKKLGKFHYILADGNLADTDAYLLDIEWLGQKKRIDVISSNDDIALVGMELLQEAKTIIDPKNNILSIKPAQQNNF